MRDYITLLSLMRIGEALERMAWCRETAGAIGLSALIASGDVRVDDAKDGKSPDDTLAACGYEEPS